MNKTLAIITLSAILLLSMPSIVFGHQSADFNGSTPLPKFDPSKNKVSDLQKIKPMPEPFPIPRMGFDSFCLDGQQDCILVCCGWDDADKCNRWCKKCPK